MDIAERLTIRLRFFLERCKAIAKEKLGAFIEIEGSGSGFHGLKFGVVCSDNPSISDDEVGARLTVTKQWLCVLANV